MPTYNDSLRRMVWDIDIQEYKNRQKSYTFVLVCELIPQK